MKLALLGIYHETNTFSRVKADYDAFNIYRGEEIIDENNEKFALLQDKSYVNLTSLTPIFPINVILSSHLFLGT